MAQVADSWTGQLEDDSPLSGTELYPFLDALRTGINSVNGTQIDDDSIVTAKLGDAAVNEAKVLWTTSAGLFAPHLPVAERKMIYGKLSVTQTATSQVHAIDWSVDGEDSPADFNNTTGLTVLAVVEYDPAVVTEDAVVSVDNIVVGGFDAQIVLRAAWSTNRTIIIHFIAMGRSAT